MCISTMQLQNISFCQTLIAASVGAGITFIFTLIQQYREHKFQEKQHNLDLKRKFYLEVLTFFSIIYFDILSKAINKLSLSTISLWTDTGSKIIGQYTISPIPDVFVKKFNEFLLIISSFLEAKKSNSTIEFSKENEERVRDILSDLQKFIKNDLKFV